MPDCSVTSPFKEYVGELIRALQRELFMHEWTIHVEFDHDLGDLCKAEVSILADYFECTIKISDDLRGIWIDTKDNEFVCKILLHELCHTLTQPLWELAKEGLNFQAQELSKGKNEQQVCRITNIIMALLPKELYERPSDVPAGCDVLVPAEPHDRETEGNTAAPDNKDGSAIERGIYRPAQRFFPFPT